VCVGVFVFVFVCVCVCVCVCECVILSSVACPARLYFSKLFHKRKDFRKKVIDYKMCVYIFSTTFVWNISHSNKSSARYDQKYMLDFT